MKDILYSSDCYKLSHKNQYPKGTTKIQSNWVARSDKFAKTSNGVVHYGITNFVYELQKWEEFFFGMDDVEFAHYIYDYRYMVEDILEVGYDTTHFVELRKLGYLPIKICSVTEGVLHSLQTPLVTVENTHPDFFWLVNYLETTLSASLWLPSTSATIAHEMHNILDKFYDKTGANKAMIPYACHDFSYRGMGGDEAAMLSGLGHLNSFSGSDTLPAIKRYKELYGEHKGNSVNATEHSVMTVNGIDGEYETFKTLIDNNPSGILSIVSDGYDYFKVLTETLPSLKDKIMDRDGKLVVRPDSGVPIDIICGSANIYNVSYSNDLERAKYWFEEHMRDEMRSSTPHGKRGEHEKTGFFKYDNKLYEATVEFEWDRWDKQYYYFEYSKVTKCKEVELNFEQKGSLELLGETFGYTINDKGYKVLNEKIGLIYGDGMTIESITAILTRMEQQGWSADNIVFGVGSFTYQYNTRDTYGFAFKATYAEVNGEKRDIFKSPATDPGKKSLTGYFELPNVVYMDGKNGKELAEQTMQHLNDLGE